MWECHSATDLEALRGQTANAMSVMEHAIATIKAPSYSAMQNRVVEMNEMETGMQDTEAHMIARATDIRVVVATPMLAGGG